MSATSAAENGQILLHTRISKGRLSSCVAYAQDNTVLNVQGWFKQK